MSMSTPTDRLYQGITMNHTIPRSETVALSYGGEGELTSRPRMASLPDLGVIVGRHLRIPSENESEITYQNDWAAFEDQFGKLNNTSHNKMTAPNSKEDQNVLITSACLRLPAEAAVEKVQSDHGI